MSVTDEERLELAKKLDEELDDFINGLKKKPCKNGWSEDKWEEDIEKHPFFMNKPPEPGDKLHPLYEGLQQLKYDPKENTPNELANIYKEDGNFNFKHKNYRLAVLSYTEGIKLHCEDEIKALLLNNRSAAQFYLKNYRSSLRDCKLALKLKPSYSKVLSRAANCSFLIEQYQECIDYCDKMLEQSPESKEFLNLRQSCVNSLKTKERDERRKEIVAKKQKILDDKIIEEVLKRNINVELGDGCVNIEALQPCFEQLWKYRVHLDENGKELVWPVVLLYPEHAITEFVQRFRESDRFVDHLNIMFEIPPEWDKEKKYAVENLIAYYENKSLKKVFPIDVNSKLGTILPAKTFVVANGTPSFFILVKGSSAHKDFLNNFS